MRSHGSGNNAGISKGIPWQSTVKHDNELLPVHPFYVYNILHTFFTFSKASGDILVEYCKQTTPDIEL